MFSAFILASLVSLFSAPAHADQICYDMQVCGEVCDTYTISPTTTYPSLTTSNVRTLRTVAPAEVCHTECDTEEYCYPEDYTDGGEGADYGTDDIDACYQEQLLVDQIRCIQMLGS